jgi:hypothetical protein
MCPDLTFTLAQRFGEMRAVNFAPLVPLAALCAAINLLTLERAWCDGRGWLMRMARGAG